MKKAGLTTWIILAMVAGIVTGLLIHYTAGEDWIDHFSDGMSILTDIFLRLIKMIIAPLVFSTLVTGIAKMGDTSAVGRIGAKTLAWFLGASLISLMLGLLIMNVVNLGSSLQLPIPATTETAGHRMPVHFPSEPLSPIFSREVLWKPWPTMKFCRSWCLPFFLESPLLPLEKRGKYLSVPWMH